LREERGTPKKVVHQPQQAEDIVRRPTTFEGGPFMAVLESMSLEDVQGSCNMVRNDDVDTIEQIKQPSFRSFPHALAVAVLRFGCSW
jgi:hypothetical protein